MGVFSPAICAIQKVMSGYNIANAYLLDNVTGYWSKTLTTSATHSGSVWLCRTNLGGVEPILDGAIFFNALDQLVVNGLTSTAVYRDSTAFLHVFWNATGAWVNGDAVTGTGTYATASIVNPRWGFDGTNYAGMYFADHAFWDGSSVALNGGKTDLDTGNWIAASPTASTYTVLDWTVNGTITQVTSTPADVATTWDPLNIVNSFTIPTLLNGNRRVEAGGSGHVLGTMDLRKFNFAYWEYYIDQPSSNNLTYLGISDRDYSNNYAGSDDAINAWGIGYFIKLGTPLNWGTAGDTIGYAWDNVNGFVYMHVNGTWANGASIADIEAGAGTNASWSFNPALVNTPVHPWTGSRWDANWHRITIKVPDTDWAYAAPTGYIALTTSNLPARSPKTPTTPQTGSFTGNGNADGPFISLGMVPDKAMVSTINGNTITWGTHADATANGVKLRTSSASYNLTGTNTYSIAVKAYLGGLNVPPANAQGN